MTWAVLVIAALLAVGVIAPWALRRWRLRRGAPELKPYDRNLRKRWGRRPHGGDDL